MYFLPVILIFHEAFFKFVFLLSARELEMSLYHIWYYCCILALSLRWGMLLLIVFLHSVMEWVMFRCVWQNHHYINLLFHSLGLLPICGEVSDSPHMLGVKLSYCPNDALPFSEVMLFDMLLLYTLSNIKGKHASRVVIIRDLYCWSAFWRKPGIGKSTGHRCWSSAWSLA